MGQSYRLNGAPQAIKIASSFLDFDATGFGVFGFDMAVVVGING